MVNFANMRTRWTNGDLEFLDKSSNIIATWDGTNRKLTFPSGSVLDLSAATGILSMAAGEIVAADLATGAVTTAKIAAGAVTAAELGANAVETAKINANAVTAAKLGANLAIGILPLDITALREIATNDIPNLSDTPATAGIGNGGVLAGNTTPTLKRVNAATDKALRVTWAAANVDEVQFPPTIMPPDLDSTANVEVHLLAKMAGATDVPTIDVQAFDGIGDVEMGGVTAALSNTLAELSVALLATNISGNPTGFLNIALVPGAHGTDALELYGAWIEYTRKT